MNNERLKFSVIIPTYNRKRLLSQCLDSIFQQTYPPEFYEVIVVDDGSTDGTDDMIMGMKGEGRPLRYLRQKNQGPASARNRGVEESGAGNLIFLDSDCVLNENFMERLDGIVRMEPDIAAFGVPATHIFSDGFFAPLSDYWREYTRKKNGSMGPIMDRIGGPWFKLCTDCCYVKKEVFLSVSGFDTRFEWAGEDPDFWFRLLKAGYRIRLTCDLGTLHYERSVIRDLVKKYFQFGMSDLMHLKTYFSKTFSIEFLALKRIPSIYFPRFPFTLHMRIDFFHVVTLLMLLSVPFPGTVAGAFLLIVLLYYRRTRSLSLTFRLLLFLYLYSGSAFLGSLVGSFRNRLIFIG